MASLIHSSTILQTSEEPLKYYNVDKDIENFINTIIFDKEGDGKGLGVLNDPTYNGFKIFFHFDSKTGLLADESNTNSALAYLKRIKQDFRYYQLKVFIKSLSELSIHSAWIFKDIEGLAEIFNNPFSNVLKEHEINLKTYETIDYKLMRLITLYRDIAFDQNRGVWILPSNLRKFSCSIYIFDSRYFDSTSSLAINNVRNRFNDDIENSNHILIDCGTCEFTNNSGKEFFGNISNILNNTPNENNLTFKFSQLYIDSFFRNNCDSDLLSQFNSVSLGDRNDKKRNKYVEYLLNKVTNTDVYRNIKTQYDYLTSMDTYKTELGKIIDNNVNNIVNSVNNRLMSLYLGNVFGFGFSDIMNVTSSESLTAINTRKQITESTTQSLKQNKVDDLGNINN